MGLSSENDRREAMKLCMFDLRRGQTEGQELDKILFFYPADLPLTTQLSVIGLSEGLITFTRVFSPDAPCEVIEAEKHCHVFYEVEPDIWMVMVVEKENPEAIWRVDALRSVLKEIHSLFMMFHGYIRALVDKEPSGGLVRSHLYYFIMDFLRDFSIGKNLQLPNFRDSLKEQGTLQMLTVGREAAIEVQSLVTLLESCVGNKQCYSMTMFQDLLVSTNLSPIDTLNLFTYAVRRLTPIALFRGASAWSSSRKTDTACNTYAGALQVTSVSAIDQYYNSHDPSPIRRHNYPLVRPLQHSKWSKGKDGFLTTDIWAYQHRGLTVILLVPVSSVSGDQGISMLKQQIIENASLKMLKVEEKLSRGWGGENAYHVSGYRYLLVDGDRYVSRASPPGKVTTLTKESLVALTKLREEVDSEKARAKWDNSGREKDIEICIRAKNNSWLIARLVRGKELYMVLPKGSETLLFAADATEKFSERYCNGAFSLD
ncbi:Vacuolar fusion protein CCZ1 B, variant 2 [Salvia divinorum]|uniref:Vacuolar fusion protein CCZ1 B, variant 2 n=1 Tax=Salvia divinorum TaxID=28513 RepID=A0ABD1HPB0_SALDI